jgi:hypothetical protein
MGGKWRFFLKPGIKNLNAGLFFGFRYACQPEADAMWILLGWVLSLKLIELFDSEPCLTD